MILSIIWDKSNQLRTILKILMTILWKINKLGIILMKITKININRMIYNSWKISLKVSFKFDHFRITYDIIDKNGRKEYGKGANKKDHHLNNNDWLSKNIKSLTIFWFYYLSL